MSRRALLAALAFLPAPAGADETSATDKLRILYSTRFTFTDDGLPLSVQIVGRPSGESTLIALSAQIERERPWADKRPKL